MKISRMEQLKTINDHERATFRSLFTEEYGDRLALVRTYLDNVPTTAVCLVDRDVHGGDFFITPLYVQVTDDMDLKGPDGEPLSIMTDH